MAEQQKHILIVEDDFELCELLAQAVRDQSDTYDVKATKNVDEAMAYVRKFQERQRTFDLVITDIKMTGLSGLELLEVLNSVSPETKTIVMTAYNSAELAERAQELKVFAYLTKPFIISEFRRIVRDAIVLPREEQDEPTPQLSVAQQRAVNGQLATLRVMTGANAALLIHCTGATLALDSLEPDIEVTTLSEALMTAQHHIAQQIKADLGADAPVKQSYFGTDVYNVCSYQVNESLFAAVIFGPAVKEGQVWYYMRDAAKALTLALESVEEEPVSAGTSVKDELMAMLDQYIPATQSRRGSRRTSSSRTASRPRPAAPEPVKETLPRSEPVVSEPDLSLVDDIDWELAEETDWDTMVTETLPGFDGISLEQAQQQGLVSPEIVPSSGQKGQANEPVSPDQGPSVDDIDWDVSADMDWEELAAETDQGFGGISLDEAQKKGIIDGLNQE